MAATTSIEWTRNADGTAGKTWNPVTGCTKVSPGCKHCYAEGVAARFWASQYPPVEYETYSVDNCCAVTEMRARKFTDVQCHADRLAEPLSWRKPARVFVNSMSDLFHEDVPNAFIDQVFAAMALAPDHTFQVLTKRADRMLAYLTAPGRHDAIVEAMDMPSWLPAGRRFLRVPENWPMPNVWLGVSVENQHFMDERLPLLIQTPAAVRFLSCEPLIGPIDFASVGGLAPLRAAWTPAVPGIDWVIVGGESGRGARPFHVEWAKSIVAQCKSAGVPVFMKQLGADPRWGPDGWKLDMLRDRKGGDIDEWPDYYVGDLRVRQFPEAR